MQEAFKFVSDIWGEDEGYVRLARKYKTGGWEEFVYQWPHQSDEVKEWLVSSNNMEANAYWCPTPFNQPKAKKEFVKPTNLLWADLDEANPKKFPNKVKPSVAWESSPGRYQALWFLDKILPTAEIELLNKKMSYFVGADKGGWDLTQVLRIPGMRNFKYPDAPRGKMLWEDKKCIYNNEILNTMLPEVTIQDIDIDEVTWLEEGEDLNSLIRPYIKKFDKKLIELLFMPEDEVEMYDRSEKLWELECRLAEIDVKQEDIVKISALSPWNKYKGRHDEVKRLNIEARKALDNIETKEIKIAVPKMEWISYGQLQGQNIPTPQWLIENFWGRYEQGMVAGEPKTYKSVITTDLALSVASGQPFLGQFNVLHPGPVLMVQQENSPFIMKDRTMKMAKAKGLYHGDYDPNKNEVWFPDDLPLYMLNNAGFDLTNLKHLSMLENKMADIKPELVVIDPLYLMLGGADENNIKELRPILNHLMALKTAYNCAFILVHHWNKGGMSKRGGQRMLGSVAFHGWVESAMYCRIKDEKDHVITVEREFRAFEKPQEVNLKFALGKPGEAGYDVEMQEESAATEDELIVLLTANQGLTEAEISAALGWGRTKTRNRIKSLVDNGTITVSGGGKGRGNSTTYGVKEGK